MVEWCVPSPDVMTLRFCLSLLCTISVVKPHSITDLNYLYQPLLHALIFIIEMVVVSRLIAKFNSYYAEKPGMAFFGRRLHE